jgi:subtilase-type serine protease
MSQLKSLTALALTAAGLLAAGCSSSSSSSSSVPAATSPAATTPAATSPSATLPASSPAASSPAVSTPALVAGPPSAADCKIIKPISAAAIGNLTPVSSEPKAKAVATLTAYIATLKAAEAKLTTTGGKKAIDDFIAALQKSETESTSKATTLMIGALGTLGKACP